MRSWWVEWAQGETLEPARASEAQAAEEAIQSLVKQWLAGYNGFDTAGYERTLRNRWEKQAKESFGLAEIKARMFLLSVLSGGEKLSWERSGFSEIQVRSKTTKDWFIIRTGGSLIANIYRGRENMFSFGPARWCGYAPAARRQIGGVPRDDLYASQVLALRYDTQRFLKSIVRL